MSSTLLLLHLVGAVCLLMWGLGMLKSGMNRAFGPRLRVFLAGSTRNAVSAFGAGFLATLIFQSSTAMAVLASGFVAQGLIAPAMAQAIMLGANIGTSIVAQVLALDLQWLMPVAFIAGVTANRRPGARAQGLAKGFIGLGLMFLSLSLVSETTAPIRGSGEAALVFGMLDNAPVIAILLAAVLAAISASSLAAVLFIMALAGAGVIDTELSLLLVAGANLGGAIPPVIAVAHEGIAARRVAISNLFVRGLGVLALLAVISQILPFALNYQSPAGLVVDFHVAFNIALALLILPFIGLISRFVAWILPERQNTETKPYYQLDETALSNPPAALAVASRETLRMGDVAAAMLETSLSVFRDSDAQGLNRIRDLDDDVDKSHASVRLYLARLDRSQLTPDLTRQAEAILDYAMNLEHIGDIIEGSLSRLLNKKIDKHLRLSAEGAREIESLLLETLDNLQMAQSVFLGRDRQLAIRLVETKLAVRLKAQASLDSHLTRLQSGRPDTIQTTSLHLDMVRDLKRINAHLIYVAYPILEDAGLLRESRLKKKKHA